MSSYKTKDHIIKEREICQKLKDRIGAFNNKDDFDKRFKYNKQHFLKYEDWIYNSGKQAKERYLNLKKTLPQFLINEINRGFF